MRHQMSDLRIWRFWSQPAPIIQHIHAQRACLLYCSFCKVSCGKARQARPQLTYQRRTVTKASCMCFLYYCPYWSSVSWITDWLGGAALVVVGRMVSWLILVVARLDESSILYTIRSRRQAVSVNGSDAAVVFEDKAIQSKEMMPHFSAGENVLSIGSTTRHSFKRRQRPVWCLAVYR